MNETIRTLQNLRTIHGDFSDRRISDEDMRLILDCAVRAANASGRQSYSIVTTSDREKMKHLCGYTGDRLLLFCVDFTRIVDLAEHLGHSFDVGDILGFVTGSTDTILAAQSACIAARSLGIDSLFTNGIHRGDVSRVHTLFGLPEQYCFPLIALVLGYAVREPDFQKGRLSGPGVIHEESYHRLTVAERDAIVAEYDASERRLGLTQNWAREGLSHYLDWFYTKWSRKVDTQTFWNSLQKSGFLP